MDNEKTLSKHQQRINDAAKGDSEALRQIQEYLQGFAEDPAKVRIEQAVIYFLGLKLNMSVDEIDRWREKMDSIVENVLS